MKYISTRGGIEPVAFSDALMMGMARDGGLLLPSEVPNVSDQLAQWSKLSYADLAFEIIRLYADLPEDDLRNLIKKSYSTFRHNEVTPLTTVNDLSILELFHGPTLAFKDIALQLLGNLFEYILTEKNAKLNILAATSGDTGSAAIHGVKGRDGIKIFVMHPKGRISQIQERQMTTVLDDNVFNIAIEGTFDHCQQIMKTIFNDLEFKDRFSLGAVNSINWARLLAQIVYYFYAALQVMRNSGADSVNFSVPTGNFGDIFAGYLAVKMGLPVSRLVLATNENDILSRFYNSGIYRLGEVHATFSPSMDIQVASNFERYLYYRAGENPERLKELMEEFSRSGQLKVEPLADGRIDDKIVAGSGNNEATLATIREFYEKHGYLLDPHTAVGVCVSREYQDENKPMICLATAHPAKFNKAIKEATGKDLDLAHHTVIDGLKDMPTRCDELPALVPAVREYIQEKLS
ncbi:threonine synthase [Verrucomicrobiota bacterium]